MWRGGATAAISLLLISMAQAFLLPAPAPKAAQPHATTIVRQRAPEVGKSLLAVASEWGFKALALVGSSGLMWQRGAISAAHAVPVVERQSVMVAAEQSVKNLNDILKGVVDIKTELESEKSFNALGEVQKVFDLDRIKEVVDETLAAARVGRQGEQTDFVEKQKVVDKVLRQVLNDVVVIEDTLRKVPPEKTGAARMKKIEAPLNKLQSDMKRLTAALTSQDDAAGAAGIRRPLFSLCADGYLLCEPK